MSGSESEDVALHGAVRGKRQRSAEDEDLGSQQSILKWMRHVPGPLQDVMKKLDNSQDHSRIASANLERYSVQIATVFDQGPWVEMCQYLGMSTTSGKLYGDIKISKLQCTIRKIVEDDQALAKIPQLLVLIKSVRYVDEQIVAVFHDPTGEVKGYFHRELVEQLGPALVTGVGVLLYKVSVFTPTDAPVTGRRKSYLNITPRNVQRVFMTKEQLTALTNENPVDVFNKEKEVETQYESDNDDYDDNQVSRSEQAARQLLQHSTIRDTSAELTFLSQRQVIHRNPPVRVDPATETTTRKKGTRGKGANASKGQHEESGLGKWQWGKLLKKTADLNDESAADSSRIQERRGFLDASSRLVSLITKQNARNRPSTSTNQSTNQDALPAIGKKTAGVRFALDTVFDQPYAENCDVTELTQRSPTFGPSVSQSQSAIQSLIGESKTNALEEEEEDDDDCIRRFSLSLPLPLLRIVLGFAVCDYDEDVFPGKRSVALSALKELKLVAKAWVVPMREISQQFELSVLTITLKKNLNQDEQQQIYQSAAERGERVTELHIRMSKSSGSKHTRDEWNALDVAWSQVFALLSELKLLNLDGMRLNAEQLISVLDAAAIYCPKLRSLTRPRAKDGADEQHIEAVMKKLYESLKRWRVCGNLGGLRRVKVPSRNSDQRNSKELFDYVIANCPQVELLDCYKESLYYSDRLVCDDSWQLTLWNWNRFNATCTNLHEFNWVVVPFGDPFFRVFGEHIKPQLKKLTFAVNMYWKWQWYFQDTSEAAGPMPGDWEQQDYCERLGYGYLATDVSAGLKDCPMLEDLSVELYHPIGPDVDTHLEQSDYDDFPEHEVINANVFDDQFCDALATHCPFVSRFAIAEVAERINSQHMKPIETFTDRGLLALGRLECLQSLLLRSVSCTGKGVFQFLNSLSEEFQGNCTFDICIGGNDSQLTFYEEVKSLLLHIAQAMKFPCTRRKFVLVLGSSFHSRNTVTLGWSATYWHELEEIMNRVKAAHPSLRQLVVTVNRVNDTFSRISEFGLYSAHADPAIDSEWEHLDAARENDGITVVNVVERGENEDNNYHHNGARLENHGEEDQFWDFF